MVNYKIVEVKITYIVYGMQYEAVLWWVEPCDKNNNIYTHIYIYTGYTQKNGAVSKVNKKFISRLTRAQRTPSAAATVQVSHALPAVRFSCLLRGQFPRWRRNRKRLSACSVLRCPYLWLRCSVSFVHCNNRYGHLKTEHTESLFLLRRHLGNWPRGPAVSMRSELLVAHGKLGQLPLLTVYVVPV